MANSLLKISAKRVKVGVEFKLHAHPIIEEFFKNRAGLNGDNTPSVTYTTGCFTRPDHERDAGDNELTLYSQSEDVTLYGSPSSSYNGSTQRRGQLIESSVINLSFLRLPGISTPEGRTVWVRQVFPAETVQEYLEQAALFTRRLYTNYLAPYTLNITVSFGKE